jgi:hypothetical protein
MKCDMMHVNRFSADRRGYPRLKRRQRDSRLVRVLPISQPRGAPLHTQTAPTDLRPFAVSYQIVRGKLWCATQSRPEQSHCAVSLFCGNLQGILDEIAHWRAMQDNRTSQQSDISVHKFPARITGNSRPNNREYRRDSGHDFRDLGAVPPGCPLVRKRDSLYKEPVRHRVDDPYSGGARSGLRLRLHSGIAPTDTGRRGLPMRGCASTEILSPR